MVKANIAVAASGIRVTTLVGEISHSSDTSQSALMVLANSSSGLSDMSIVNHSGRDNNYSSGVWYDCCATISNVTIIVDGGIHQTGIGAGASSASVFLNSTVRVSGGLLSNTGVDYIQEAVNSTISVSGSNSLGFRGGQL